MNNCKKQNNYNVINTKQPSFSIKKQKKKTMYKYYKIYKIRKNSIK